MKKEKLSLIDEAYLNDLKRTAMYYQAEKTAYELKLLYEWCCKINEDINTIFEDTLKPTIFNDKEKEVILANAIQLLKIKYRINIECKKPILKMDKVTLFSHTTNQ